MRVLFFLRTFPAVSETFVVHQVEGVLARGHQVVVTADQPATEADTALKTTMPLTERVLYRPRGWSNRYLRAGQTLLLATAHGWRAPTEIRGSLNISRFGREARSGRALRALIPLLSPRARGFTPEIVHAHFGPSGLLAAVLKELGVIKAPLAVTFHGYDANVMPRRMGPRYYDLLFSTASRIMVGTEFMKNRLLELGAPRERIIKLPMGVDIASFERHRIPEHAPDRPVVLSVGRLVGNKGLGDGLTAFRQAVQRFPKAQYWIVGEGPERPALERIARELGIDDRTKLLGNQDRAQLMALYGQADLFLHPSKRGEDGSVEGQGLVLAEAAAARLPIVATGVGGIPETVVHNENGLLAEQGDAAGLAAHMITLLGNPERRAEMGRMGRRRVEERFDLRRLNDQLIEVYRETIREKAE